MIFSYDDRFSELARQYPELYTKGFEDFCEQQIFPLLRRKKRKQIENKSSKFKTYLRTIFFVFCGVFIFFFYLEPLMKIVISLVILINIYLFSEFGKILMREFVIKSQRKEEILPKLFSLFSNCEYLTNKKEIDNFKLYLNQIKLLKSIDTNIYIHSEDFFKIKYNNLPIDLCELLIHSGNAKNKQMGYAIFYRIKTNKSFYGKTFIQSKNSYLNSENAAEVELESAKFNELFSVRTTNQTEARLFLTPAFMTRLIKFNSAFSSQNFAISFEKGYMNIYFFMEEYNSFELDNISLKRKEEFLNTLRCIIMELWTYLSLVDDLRLENIV